MKKDNFTVAYIDDDKDHLFLRSRQCKAFNIASDIHHINYHGFNEPADFLRVYRSNPEAFDAVVVDINMPSSGWELAKQVLEEKAKVVLIMCSSDVDPEDDLPSMMSKRDFRFPDLVERVCTLKKAWRSNVFQIFMRMGDMRGYI